MYQVVAQLEAIITITNIITAENIQSSNKQRLSVSASNLGSPLSTDNSELSELIKNFHQMNTRDIDTMGLSNDQENLLSDKDFKIIVDEVNDLIFRLVNKGFEFKLVKQQIIDHFNNNNTNSQEIYKWLSSNQKNSNSIFLLGYFNYDEIKSSKNNKEGF